MASPYEGLEVEEEHRPIAQLFDFDLERTLSSVVTLVSQVPPRASSARTLGTERYGNATVIGADGLLLTIGYLVTEADEIVLTTGEGRDVEAHVLGVDQATGFALLQALSPLRLPALSIGDSRKVGSQAAVIAAGGGGVAHALSGQVLARQPFAGYWEYYLEEALFVEPAHPHWSGGALIGPAGDLIGVGSLRMERHTPNGKISPLNMFVPAELAPPILPDLTLGRPARPPRPWLGVLARDDEGQVVVADTSPGGPASRAELKADDVILKIEGEPVSELGQFYQRLWSLGPPGVVVTLTIEREDDVFDIEIRSADRLAMQRKRRLN